MRTKVTLVLVFLNLALFFFIFKFERNWRTEQESLELRRRVLDAAITNLQTLRISGPAAAQTIEISREGDQWYLTQPFHWNANRFAVDRIRTELEQLEHETAFSVDEVISEGRSLADYGLAEPALTVTYISGGERTETHELQLGAATPDGNNLYVLADDGTRIHVVGNSLAESLTLPIADLRSDVIFSLPVYEVNRIRLKTIERANVNFQLQLTNNRWDITAPLSSTRANKDATDLTLNGLIGLRVNSFVTNPPANAISVTSPVLQIQLDSFNNRTETLVVGTRVNPPAGGTNGTAAATATAAAGSTGGAAYYAMLELTSGSRTETGQVFTVVIPDALKSRLDNLDRELRERRLLPDFDPTSATAVVISSSTSPEITLQRLQGTATGSLNWQMSGPGLAADPANRTADPAVVQALLRQLAELEAVDFNDSPTAQQQGDWGFNEPRRTLTLTTSTAAAPSVLVLAQTLDRTVRARVTGSNWVATVRPEILEAASVTPLDYRNRLLRELPAGARITRLTLTDLESDRVLLDADLSDPAATPAERVTALLQQLRALRARRFVPGNFDPDRLVLPSEVETQSWRYQLQTTISSASGANATQTSTGNLLFSERTTGTTQYGGSTEWGVWELETPLMDALWAIVSADTDPGPPVQP